MSGRAGWVVAAVAFAALLTAACGANGGTPHAVVAPAPEMVNPLLSTGIPLDVPLGPVITSSEARHFLPFLNDGRQSSPVAVHNGRFLVVESDPSGLGAQRFVLWDPVTGARFPAWEGAAGWQDIVTGVSGNTVVVVRTGLSLPFAEWELQLRDLATGSVQTLAVADSRVANAPGVNPGPPFGFAPYPSVSGARIAWTEYRIAGEAVERDVRLHDLATNVTRTVATASLAAMEDVGAASLGGDLVAWVRWLGNGAARIEVLETVTGAVRSLDLEARPYAIALDATGEHLAWDDARGGKYVARLADSKVRRFAGDEGWGLTVAGERFSWAPAPAYGGTGGFFDLGAGQLRLVERRTGVQVNQALVLGDWFAWQELRSSTNGAPDLANSGYYFLPLTESS